MTKDEIMQAIESMTVLELSELALADASMSQNYFMPSKEQVAEVYRKSYEGI